MVCKGEIWRHYKGGRYVIIGMGIGQDSINNVSYYIENRNFIIYKALYQTALFVRSVEDFYSEVTEGSITKPRFEKIANEKSCSTCRYYKDKLCKLRSKRVDTHPSVAVKNNCWEWENNVKWYVF